MTVAWALVIIRSQPVFGVPNSRRAGRAFMPPGRFRSGSPRPRVCFEAGDSVGARME